MNDENDCWCPVCNAATPKEAFLTARSLFEEASRDGLSAADVLEWMTALAELRGKLTAEELAEVGE